MRRKSVLIFSAMALLAGAITYTANQPSLECQSSKDVANRHWDRANIANNLSTDLGLRGVYGDFQNPDSELRYKKSLYELRRVEHLYKLSASKITLENQECFTKTEIIKARVELEVQKSFEGYFAE